MPQTEGTRSLQAKGNDAGSPVALEVTAGPHAGQIFGFSLHDTFVVGRSRQAHFCLPAKDPYFSRFHFLVEVNPPSCRLVDLESHNGTLVNGQKVTAIDLKDGDEIRGGATVFRVRIQGGCTDPFATVGPEGATDCAADLLDRVVDEILLRRQSGEKPDVQNYLCRYPQLRGALQLALAAENSVSTLSSAAVLPVIPGYVIERELGRGGMGVVYHAVRTLDSREVAIKTIASSLKTSKEASTRFLREARILSDLQHPHIVSFLEMGQTDQFVYFTMEFVAGVDARILVQKNGPLPVARAARIMLQVLEALAYAHRKGFVHRDLKPANVLVVENTDGDTARIADFGLARAYQESPLSGLTMSRDIMGTPQFMPPEQILSFRSVQPAADQYAAAATLYFLLTGSPHFDARTSVQELYRCILQEDPVRIEKRCPDLPPALANLIHRGLARDRSQRFADVLAMHQALIPFAATTVR